MREPESISGRTSEAGNEIKEPRLVFPNSGLALISEPIEGKVLAARGVVFCTTLGRDQAELLMQVVRSGLYGSSRSEVLRELVLAGIRRAVTDHIIELPEPAKRLEAHHG
jgi:hypothetical protein